MTTKTLDELKAMGRAFQMRSDEPYHYLAAMKDDKCIATRNSNIWPEIGNEIFEMVGKVPQPTTPNEAIAAGVALLPILRRHLLEATHDDGEELVEASTLAAVIAALSAMEGVAKGTHVVVPVEPTQEMLDAAYTYKNGIPGGISFTTIYRAMIATSQENNRAALAPLVE
jgi:hypothetical protein